MGLTLETLLVLAARRLGSRKAVFYTIGISRQRFHSAMRGGPPLHTERLLRLALAAGVDPLDALRAGGRGAFADLLEEVARPRLRETTVPQRALLDEYAHLSRHTQGLVMGLVSGLAAERRGDVLPDGREVVP